MKVIGQRDEGSKKIVPPSKGEMKSILEHSNDDLRFMILFAASTGTRAGEQWGLRWSDIDFDISELNIQRRVDSYGDEGPPKSAAGIRSVPLSEMLVRMLRKWRLQSRFSGGDDYIFPNKKGRHNNYCEYELVII